MALELLLPYPDGSLAPYTLKSAGELPSSASPSRSRVAYAAAHVVCDPLADSPGEAVNARLDWNATLAYRHYLWSLGLSVAEAMDTAQRGMGLNWETSKELIRRSCIEARTREHAGIACGAGTDHLDLSTRPTLADVESAYEEQCAFIEGQGGQIIVMASRALAACAKTPDEYRRVYGRILSQVSRPVILHWLGTMFDPALAGYWGSHDLDVAMEVCLSIIRDHSAKIDGIKISLLDARREIALRRLLPRGVRMYSGDDFSYPELIRGDEQGHSHALLGIFDAIAPAAAAALQALDAGDTHQYEAILGPTVPLARHIFRPPTYHYKVGIVFMAYLNGHQAHFRMVSGVEGMRSITHLAQLFMLADQAGLLLKPDRALERMRNVLVIAGIQ